MSTTTAAATAAAPSSTPQPQYRGKWQREDVLLLLRAWSDVADQRDASDDGKQDNESESDGGGEESAAPPHEGNDQRNGATVNEPPGTTSDSKKRLRAHLYEEKIAEFDARVYRRFLVLSGGDNATHHPANAEIQESAGESASRATQEAEVETKQDEALPAEPSMEPVPSLNRSERAVIEKKDALMHSYHFIAQWMSSSANNGDPGERRDWFALTKEQQKQEVRSRFKRIVFVYMDHEMFSALEQLAQKKQKSKMRDRVGFQHWHDSEHVQLLRAWGEALRIVGTKRDLNRVLTERFLALGSDDNGVKRQRSEASIIARKENMVFSYLFISAFSAQNEHKDWFSLTKSEKKQILLNAGHKSTRFVDIDEDMFDIIGMHLHTRVKKARRASNGEDAAAMETSAPSTPLVDTEAEVKEVLESTGTMEYDASANKTSTQKDGAGAAVDVDTIQDVEAVTLTLDQEKLPQNVVLSAELYESDIPEDPPSSEANAGSSDDPENLRRSEADAEPLDILLPESRSDDHALDNEESRVRDNLHDNMEIHQNKIDPPGNEADAEPLDALEFKLRGDVLDNESSRVPDNSLDDMEIHQNEPDLPSSEENAEPVESFVPESPKIQQQQQPVTTAPLLEFSFPEWDKEYASTRNNVFPAEDSREGSTTPPADPEQEAILTLFQKYADHFNTTLRQMQEDEESGREQRKREREELRVELEKRRRYREELVQDREQRTLERDRMSQELEQMRVERQRERDHDLALLRTLLKQAHS